MKIKWLLVLLLTISFLLRIWRINYPDSNVWDEIYYSYTAKQYLKMDKTLFDFSSTAFNNKLYVWENPPFPIELMAIVAKIFNNTSIYIFRIPGVLLGTISIYLVYLLGERLFKNKRPAFIAALLFSVDGLNFVLSRVAMLDIYLVTFILLSLIFFLKKQFLLSFFFLGLAISSKWTAMFLLPIYILIFFNNKYPKRAILFFAVTPLVYVICYAPFFLTGYSFVDFINLIQKQLLYHLNMKLSSIYASAWWSWPLILKPVWFFTEFQKNQIAIIIESGTILLWLGLASLFFSIYHVFKKREFNLLIVVLCFLLFWLPWAFSQRTMFIYYFAPAVPFLCLSLGFEIDKLLQIKSGRFLAKSLIVICLINFLIFYPLFTGMLLPKKFVELIFRTTI